MISKSNLFIFIIIWGSLKLISEEVEQIEQFLHLFNQKQNFIVLQKDYQHRGASRRTLVLRIIIWRKKLKRLKRNSKRILNKLTKRTMTRESMKWRNCQQETKFKYQWYEILFYSLSLFYISPLKSVWIIQQQSITVPRKIILTEL